MLRELEVAYLDLCDTILEENYTREPIQVVITMSFETFARMCCEERMKLYRYGSDIKDVEFINLCGLKTPVIFDESLPDDKLFVLRLRKDYERLEIQNLYDKFYKMFEEINR